jgi:hypothetical protein
LRDCSEPVLTAELATGLRGNPNPMIITVGYRFDENYEFAL